MRPAPRVYGSDLHLDKSGLSLHLPIDGHLETCG